MRGEDGHLKEDFGCALTGAGMNRARVCTLRVLHGLLTQLRMQLQYLHVCMTALNVFEQVIRRSHHGGKSNDWHDGTWTNRVRKSGEHTKHYEENVHLTQYYSE